MSEKDLKKKLLFTIDGFEVYDNSTYLIADKKDGDAPSGFVDAGVSKLPSDGVDEVFQCPYKKTSATTGIWDTGFYEFSPCYGDMSEDEQKIMVKTLTENVLKPYRKVTGQADIFKQGHDNLIENLSFKVKSGKVFHTANPIERMELYMAIHSRTVTPHGQEGASKYRESFYVVFDTTKKAKQKDEKNVSFFKAATLFSKFYEQDRDKLFSILSWIGMPKILPTIDEDTLTSIFSEYIKTSPDRVRAFLDATAEISQNVGYNKITIYKALKEMSLKGMKIKKSPSGMWFYGEDIEIGPDLKSAAENIAKNSSLAKVKNEIMLEEE